jgi:hypothetical protein
MWGWFVKCVRWLGYACRILRKAEEAIEEKEKGKDQNGCDE